MKKLDEIDENTKIPCPECGELMEQNILSNGLVSGTGIFICTNEKCKFLGIPRLIGYMVSDKFLGRQNMNRKKELEELFNEAKINPHLWVCIPDCIWEEMNTI